MTIVAEPTLAQQLELDQYGIKTAKKSFATPLTTSFSRKRHVLTWKGSSAV